MLSSAYLVEELKLGDIILQFEEKLKLKSIVTGFYKTLQIVAIDPKFILLPFTYNSLSMCILDFVIPSY